MISLAWYLTSSSTSEIISSLIIVVLAWASFVSLLSLVFVPLFFLAWARTKICCAEIVGKAPGGYFWYYWLRIRFLAPKIDVSVKKWGLKLYSRQARIG